MVTFLDQELKNDGYTQISFQNIKVTFIVTFIRNFID